MPEFYENPTVAPLLFDDSFAPKPAYFAVLDVLARDLGETPVLTDEEVTAMITPTVAFVEIGEPVSSDPAQLAPDSAHGALYYVAYPVTITLDGNPSDWANIPRDTVFDGPLTPDDTQMTFAAAADDEHFYFLAEVQDSNIVYGDHPLSSEWYKEDSVEFYLNTTGDLTLTEYQPGIAQIAIPAANLENTGSPADAVIAGGNSRTVDVQAVVVRTDTGYRVEAAVPLQTAVWSITPERGGILGFQVHLNGSSGNERETKLIWSAYDREDQSWTNPSVFGQLMFWNVNE
jgi:hypothetical protein